MIRASERKRISALVWAGCVVLALSAPVAARAQGPSAQAKETARALYREGNDLYAKGDYQGALRSFRGAHGIMDVATTGLGVGKAQLALGQLVEARDTLLGVSRKPALADEAASMAEARAEATQLAEQLAGRIPSLRVVLVLPDGSEAQKRHSMRIDRVEIDSAVVKLPVRLNPGEHLVVVSLSGYRTEERRVTLMERNNRVLRFELTSGTPDGAGHAPARSRAHQRHRHADAEDDRSTGISPLVPIGFTIGGAGLIVGAVAGGISLSAASDVEAMCNEDDRTCPPEAQDHIDRSVTTAHVSTVSFIVGGLGVAVGVIGLIVSGHDMAEESASWRPLIGPGFVGAEGRF